MTFSTQYTLIVAAVMAGTINATAVTTATSAENASDSVSNPVVGYLRDVEVVGVKQLPNSQIEPATRLDAEAVKALGITSMRGISDVAPNFFIPDYGSRMTSSIYVRGMGARIDQPVISLNVDGIPYLNKDNYDFDMPDIDRIEVLRGTRSVLSGRNAIGGQVNIYTCSPWSRRGWRLGASYARANTARLNAGWYGRLGKKVATSVTAYGSTTDGFYRNEYDDSHCGRERQANAGWKTSWHPGGRWSLANTATYGYVKQHGYPYAAAATGRIGYNDPASYRRNSFADGLSVSFTGNRMVATSQTSVQYLNDDMVMDQDFTRADYFTLRQKRHEWAFTQDIFAKGTRKSYDWLLGAFGFAKKTHTDAPVVFKQDGIDRLILDNVNKSLPPGMQLRWDEQQMLLNSNFDTTDGGFAIYHTSTVHLGRWTLRGGLRWDIERVSMDYVGAVNTSVTMYRSLPTGVQIPLQTRPITIDDQGSLHQTFNELLPQVFINYAPDSRWRVFGSVARGYKAGGYNTQMFSDILQQQMMEQMGMQAEYDIDAMLTYRPERNWTYEVGTGFESSDKSLSAEVLGYWMACRDQQLTIFPHGNTTGRAMTNAGRTRSIGLEVSVAFRPTQALALRASYGYTDARFTKYHNGIADMEGKKLPYAPRHTLFGGARYVLPWTFAGVTPLVDVAVHAAGRIYWDDANTMEQPFYASLDASVTLQHRLGSLRLFAENITDTRYNTFYFVSVGHAFYQKANPWSIGVSISVNIGTDE